MTADATQEKPHVLMPNEILNVDNLYVPQSGSKVLAAISKVMSEVGSVEKRGKNTFHNYSYASAADIAFALQKKVAEAGLVIVQTESEIKTHFEDTILTIKYDFLLSHVSGDRLPYVINKTGASSLKNSKGGIDDKAVNKCSTAALKYFLLGLFLIPTGDYDDADADGDVAQDGTAKPRPAATKTAPKAAAPDEPVKPPHDPVTGEVLPPHAIDVPLTNGTGDPDLWAKVYMAALRASPERIEEWVRLNAKLTSQLASYSPKSHKALIAVLEDIRANAGKPPAEVPPAGAAA